MNQPSQNKWNLLFGPLLVVLVLLVYSQSILDGGFLWDDDFYVTQNQVLRDAEGLGRMWSEPRSIPQYYPVTHTTFWIEYQSWQENALGYRLVNAILHALNALLLWRIFKRLGAPWAWMVALLFALHPLEVETVAWITERKNTLSMLFALLSFSSLLTWHEQSGAKFPITGFLFFLLALGSKTVTATLPAVFLVYCWSKQRLDRKTVLTMLPFFVISLVAAWATSHLEAEHVGANGTEWDVSFGMRLLLAPRIALFYAGKLLLPYPLCFNYERWDTTFQTTDLIWPIAALLILLVAFLGRVRWSRAPFVALLVFGGVLFPALGFINVYPFRYSFVADHFQYHAGPAFLALVCGALWQFCGKKVATIVVCLCALCCGCLTFTHAKNFRSDVHLFEQTIEVNANSWMAHNNLADRFVREKNAERSLHHAEKAVAIKDDLAETWTTLALARELNGQNHEALQAFERAAKIAPDDERMRLNLGLAYTRRRRYAQASSELSDALETNPDSTRLKAAYAGSLMGLRELSRAQSLLEEVVRQSDAIAEDYLNLAALYQRRKGREAAIALLRAFEKKHGVDERIRVTLDQLTRQN